VIHTRYDLWLMASDGAGSPTDDPRNDVTPGIQLDEGHSIAIEKIVDAGYLNLDVSCIGDGSRFVVDGLS